MGSGLGLRERHNIVAGDPFQAFGKANGMGNPDKMSSLVNMMSFLVYYDEPEV